MKKKIIIFLSIILLVSIITTLTCLFIIKPKKINNEIKQEETKELKGEEIYKGVYLYNIEKEENEYKHQTIIDNDSLYTIYFLEGKDIVYKKNIYTNQKEKVGEISLNDDKHCYIENKYITCDIPNNKTIYNAELKELYNGEPKKIIPYKNSYIEVNKGDIYFDNQLHGNINKDFNDYNVYRYSTFNNNAFIYFGNFDEENCLYNFNDNKCEDFDFYSVRDYQDGLFYSEKDKIKTINTKTNERKEYDNPLEKILSDYAQLYENNLIYMKDDYIRIYNLDNKKINLLDFRININLLDIKTYNNYLYIISEDKIYIIDLNKIETKKLTEEEINELLENKLQAKIKELSEKYNIEIKIRKEADLNFDIWDQKIKGETNYNSLIDSIDYIEEDLKLLTPDLFKEFIHDNYKGFAIYIAGSIDSKNSIGGEELKYYDKYIIISLSSNIKSTFLHELMHSLEDVIDTKNKKIFTDWSKYNPKGFKYGTFDYYNTFSPQKYTIEYGDKDAYFIDNYSETSELEDRARIFENLGTNNTDVILNYPNILKKAKYQMEEIIENYPMLKESPIWDPLKKAN